MRCYRRSLNISYKDYVTCTNEVVRRKIQAAIKKDDGLMTLVRKRKLRWFGHVSRSSGLAKAVLQDKVKRKRKGRQKRGGKTILNSGQGWILSVQLGQLKTGQGGRGLLRIHL